MSELVEEQAFVGQVLDVALEEFLDLTSESCAVRVGGGKYTARVMLLTVTCIRPVLALAGVYVCQNILHRSDIALIAAWMGTVCDMTVRMALMLKRYRSEKWHHIKV